MTGKKRLLLAAGSIASIGAVVALATGVTFGLFSATQVSGNNTFTAGTVTLDRTAQSVCAVTHVQPGDATAGYISTHAAVTPPNIMALDTTGNATHQTCTFTVKYDGQAGNSATDVNANIGLDLQFTGTPAIDVPNGYNGPGSAGLDNAQAPGLFDGSVNGLTMLIKSGSVSYVDGITYNINGATPTPVAMNEGITVANLLAGADVAPGTTITFTVDYWLPNIPATSNNYQGAATKLVMTAHAVQVDHNSAAACTLGNTCAISWS
jgi:predicted ribosomally synthesized peptide with SipW-like signal peptide